MPSLASGRAPTDISGLNAGLADIVNYLFQQKQLNQQQSNWQQQLEYEKQSDTQKALLQLQLEKLRQSGDINYLTTMEQLKAQQQKQLTPEQLARLPAEVGQANIQADVDTGIVPKDWAQQQGYYPPPFPDPLLDTPGFLKQTEGPEKWQPTETPWGKSQQAKAATGEQKTDYEQLKIDETHRHNEAMEEIDRRREARIAQHEGDNLTPEQKAREKDFQRREGILKKRLDAIDKKMIIDVDEDIPKHKQMYDEIYKQLQDLWRQEDELLTGKAPSTTTKKTHQQAFDEIKKAWPNAPDEKINAYLKQQGY